MMIETNSASETLALGEKLGKSGEAGPDLYIKRRPRCWKNRSDAGLCKRTWYYRGSQQSYLYHYSGIYRKGRLPFYHFDVYRIGDIEEMEEIGYDDYFFSVRVSA